jgi:DNA polymerase
MRLFTQPRPKNSKVERATRYTHPANGSNSVTTPRTTSKRCESSPENSRWNYKERELALWHLDQRINDRGMYVDVDFARAALRAVERAQKRLSAETTSRLVAP